TRGATDRAFARPAATRSPPLRPETADLSAHQWAPERREGTAAASRAAKTCWAWLLKSRRPAHRQDQRPRLWDPHGTGDSRPPLAAPNPPVFVASTTQESRRREAARICEHGAAWP